MTTAVLGIVRDGVIVPNSPLPEGSEVEIRVRDASEIPAALQEELQAWQRANANALDLVERLAQEGETKTYAVVTPFGNERAAFQLMKMLEEERDAS